MSWRFLSASLLVTVVFGLSSQLRADDGTPASKGAATDKSAVSDKGAAIDTVSPKAEKPAAPRPSRRRAARG